MRGERKAYTTSFLLLGDRPGRRRFAGSSTCPLPGVKPLRGKPNLSLSVRPTARGSNRCSFLTRHLAGSGKHAATRNPLGLGAQRRHWVATELECAKSRTRYTLNAARTLSKVRRLTNCSRWTASQSTKNPGREGVSDRGMCRLETATTLDSRIIRYHCRAVQVLLSCGEPLRLPRLAAGRRIEGGGG